MPNDPKLDKTFKCNAKRTKRTRIRANSVKKKVWHDQF